MIRFDDALTELVGVCERFPGFADVERACAVRDVRGRIWLILKLGRARGTLDQNLLEATLRQELGSYFRPPIHGTDDDGISADARRLAAKLIEVSQEWSPTISDPLTGAPEPPPAGRWRKVEGRLSKQTWLGGVEARAPWPLVAGKPAVVTFYSFKGGIGRSTALVSCAWQLARQQRSVVILDLDLEAPGISVLLNRAPVPRGILDFLIEHMIAKDRSIEGLLVPARELGADQERVRVASAGALGPGYLEKLARLDYADDAPWRPGARPAVQEGLLALLEAVRQAVAPDYILIDSRSGLHDLAGLSLHGLSHVDVLFGRASEQGYQGLDLTLQILARRKGAELRSVLVHAFAPPARGSDAEKTEGAVFRARAYQSFKQHVYEPLYEEAEVPGEKVEDRPHAPLIIHDEEAPRAFGSPADVEAQLLGEDYRRLAARIVELCTPEPLS